MRPPAGTLLSPQLRIHSQPGKRTTECNPLRRSWRAKGRSSGGGSTDAMSKAVKHLRRTNTAGGSYETAKSAANCLALMIGYHPLQTFYGTGFWLTSCLSLFYRSGCAATSTSTADSAYGTTLLPLHTDMMHIHNPPSTQVFLLMQPAMIQVEESLSLASNYGKSICTKGSILLCWRVCSGPATFLGKPRSILPARYHPTVWCMPMWGTK
jgi:hypothetical protein